MPVKVYRFTYVKGAAYITQNNSSKEQKNITKKEQGKKISIELNSDADMKYAISI
jgi:hypothetical protein